MPSVSRYFLNLELSYFVRILFGFFFYQYYVIFYRVRRRRDQEDTLNQRYPENKDKRSKDDKEVQNKCAEREVSSKEERPVQYTPQKAKPAKAVVDLGREKMLRPPVEKWKRQDDKDLREKRCFICGREGHIKKECPQFKGSPGMHTSHTLMFPITSQGKSPF